MDKKAFGQKIYCNFAANPIAVKLWVTAVYMVFDYINNSKEASPSFITQMNAILNTHFYYHNV